MSDVETRSRLTLSAAREFIGVATEWALTESQKLTLLGTSNPLQALGVWKITGPTSPLNIDQMSRISMLICIDEGLKQFFRHAAEESARWTRRPVSEAAFDGHTPLDMLELDISGVADVRQYVYSAAGGPPRRSVSGQRHG